MTYSYFTIIFLVILFLVCSSCIFDIVMTDNKFMHEIAKRLIQYSSGLGGWHYVSMVLRYSLSTVALYMLGLVVDRGCDTPIESDVVHSSYIRPSRTQLPRKIMLRPDFPIWQCSLCIDKETLCYM